jgi:hypothetical protein
MLLRYAHVGMSEKCRNVFDWASIEQQFASERVSEAVSMPLMDIGTLEKLCQCF